MKELKFVDDFYRLPEEERKSLIGQKFRQVNKPTVYFPVGLSDKQFNYGRKQGLIFITEILPNKWFRVGVHSPDDLDCDLDFIHPHTAIRQDIIDFIEKMNKKNIIYRNVLIKIQKHFRAGKITS